MKFKLKTKKTVRKILSMVLCGVLIMGVIFGAVAIGKKVTDDTKKISPKFSVGSLDYNGVYTENKGQLYTKEAFECKGLAINLDFESSIQYYVYYYDTEDNFVKMSGPYVKSIEFDVPLEATHARLVVVPLWNASVPVEDRVCHWYDTYKYTRQLEIRVAKKQDNITSLVDTLVWSKIDLGRSDANLGTNPIEKINYVTTLNPLKLEETSTIQIQLPKTGIVVIHFYDEEGNHLADQTVESPSKDAVETVSIPAESGYAYVHFDLSLANEVEVQDYEIFFRT